MLTFSCYQQLPLLGSERTATLLVEALDEARNSQKFDIWAYVVMPEHVHLLICPQGEDYSISKILFAIKRPVSYRAKREGLCGYPHFWMAGGGHDRNLWKLDVIYKELDYIHANPVRRGLCESPEQWRFSSAAFWDGRNDVPLKMDNTIPPRQ